MVFYCKPNFFIWICELLMKWSTRGGATNNTMKQRRQTQRHLARFLIFSFNHRHYCYSIKHKRMKPGQRVITEPPACSFSLKKKQERKRAHSEFSFWFQSQYQWANCVRISNIIMHHSCYDRCCCCCFYSNILSNKQTNAAHNVFIGGNRSLMPLNNRQSRPKKLTKRTNHFIHLPYFIWF